MKIGLFHFVGLVLIALILTAEAGAQSSQVTQLERSLEAIENDLKDIESKKAISERVDLDKALDEYYAALRKAHEAELQAAIDEANRTRSAQNAGKRLQAWKKHCLSNAAGWKRSQVASHRSNIGIRTGNISIPPGVLKQFPKEELEELKKWLTPETLEKYRKIDKDLFSQGPARWSPRTQKQNALQRLAVRPAPYLATRSRKQPREQQPEKQGQGERGHEAGQLSLGIF